MTDVLVVADHLLGEVRGATSELVTAGRRLGDVTLAVIARDPSSLVPAVNIEGVAEIVTVAVGSDAFENDVYQQALEALVESRRPDVILLGFTVNAMGYGPAVAAKLGLGFASDVHAMEIQRGTVVATRSFYGGQVHAELEFPDCECVLLMLRPTAWPRTSGTGTASVSRFEVAVETPRARHVEFLEPEATGDAVDIGTAECLLSIGRGIRDGRNVDLFNRLADRMGATLSASRPPVDAGWVRAGRLVGQSGKTVRPKVYLAFGISGAVQHVAGMEGAGTIIAINTDPDAAIFSVADHGAVADALGVAEELEKLYRE